VQAAYVLGPERGARCHHLLRIPTAFSLNLATAGAIVMYDRLRNVSAEARAPHVQGTPRKRRPKR
jgi:tRNA(Leu) C34 or U34 (ribose-2'-O)-methylase TrmL